MRHRKRQSKEKSLAIHTKIRMSDRYGYLPSDDDLSTMSSQCRKKRFFCHLGRESLTRSKIVIKYRDMLIPLIYDKKRHCIVTVLTMEMLSKEEREIVSAKKRSVTLTTEEKDEAETR